MCYRSTVVDHPILHIHVILSELAIANITVIIGGGAPLMSRSDHYNRLVVQGQSILAQRSLQAQHDESGWECR